MTTLSNSPPLKDRLEIEYQELADEIASALTEDRYLSLSITTDEHASMVGSSAADLTKIKRKAEKYRKNEKDEWLEGGRTVDRFFADLVAPLAAVIDKMDASIKSYQRAKLDEQRKKEEAERQLAATFGEQAPAAAPVKEAVRITTDMGVKVAGKVVWKFEVSDARALPPEFLMPNEIAIRAAVQAAKASGKKIEEVTIPGVRVYEDISTVYR